MQAVILAGGEGWRLRPLTKNRPKALIPVGNRPLIDYCIDALLASGIRDIIVVVGYRKEQVIRHLNSLDHEVRVVVQERQLGSAHALACAAPLIHDTALVLSGDTYVDADSIRMMGSDGNAIMVNSSSSPSHYGVVTVQNNYVTSFIEKPDETGPSLVSSGLYLFTPEVIQSVSEFELSDLLIRLIAEGVLIRAVRGCEWDDAIHAWDLLSQNRHLLRTNEPQKSGAISRLVTIRGNVSIGSRTTIGPGCCITGPVRIGDDTVIHPNTVIGPDVSIGSRVSIEPFTFVENSILMDDVRVGSHSRISDSVIGDGCLIADHLSTITTSGLYSLGDGDAKMLHRGTFGAILGEGVRLEPSVVLTGCILGNNVDVRSGRRLEGVIPDGSRVI
ncbi:MAG: nucleotidyl transferase [Methanocalculus sp. MSAO_Arc1]|uniref:sugar phosphate nucleotidyltransferase n=1 Tax=Methanocalculus TaxID=71151 RepID=UPI000FF024D7|nr:MULTISPECIES: sugar phosphate nucleotidyltransferase [unclassified Methanocalculus]MCP1662639.1 glucose-1-phosphate thymidylyltransferase [Methanocalculus sp. AMF5]RQD80327.1 MAG: nucleotidyl transferase [Methanocalculus sp. MSAO_Arc1]